jgi:hypothetical protein
MNRKILAIALVLIVIVGVAGLIAYQTGSGNGNNKSTELITVTYTPHSIASTDHWYTGSNSVVTDIIVVALFNSSKDVPLYAGSSLGDNASGSSKDYPLNINDFYLTSNGSPLSTYVVTVNNSTLVSSSSGIAVSRAFDFTVRGNVTSYQLSYNGTDNVKIILQSP